MAMFMAAKRKKTNLMFMKHLAKTEVIQVWCRRCFGNYYIGSALLSFSGGHYHVEQPPG